MSRSKSQKLPILSWREVVKKLVKLGFMVVHQRGSHIVLHKEGKFIAIPRHEEIPPGTLLAIIRDAGLTKEEFVKLPLQKVKGKTVRLLANFGAFLSLVGSARVFYG